MYLAEVEGKGGINTKLVAYSVSPQGKKIATFELTYHRYIHGEFMTHRLFSRNAMSSRAVPVKKMLDTIRQAPAMPIHWGKNQPGMQAREEQNVAVGGISSREDWWNEAKDSAIYYAHHYDVAGYAKQIVNRLVEPFQMMKTVMTATELDNFFWLRLDEDAQPEIFELARCMRECLLKLKPELLQPGEWHTPYVGHIKVQKQAKKGEVATREYTLKYVSAEGKELNLEEALAISSSCCAQVSYRNLDNTYEKAMAIYDRLLSGAKVHASPFEHQATPMVTPDISNGADPFGTLLANKGYTHMDKKGDFWSGNFQGWIQHRQLLDNHNCTDYQEV